MPWTQAIGEGMFIWTIHTRVMLPLPTLWMITPTVQPMHPLNSSGSLTAAAHSSGLAQSEGHGVHKHRRCTSPAASNNNEAGPSQFAATSETSVRVRRRRRLSPAASATEQGGFPGLAESSTSCRRNRRPHNCGRQAREFLEPRCCLHLPITTYCLCSRKDLKNFDVVFSLP